jgi:hypothetical protein
VTHKDYLKNDSDENYDFDSSRVGGNRYATILLYMSEVDSGGETVFEKAWPEGTTDEQKKRPLKETIHELRESGQIDLLEEGSWEEHLTALCRTRLVIRPKSGRAVLFYSQHPNGQVDEASLHGACPVLAGTKVSSTFHAIHSRVYGRGSHSLIVPSSRILMRQVGRQPLGLECSSTRVPWRAEITARPAEEESGGEACCLHQLRERSET